ncbi:ATP-binding protein [Fulvivirga ulvae]|uniref:histidine kinase dimerization/phosphoacceptor domain -containing protein n=1 Tax=Fulvivirga ulvae TaxID=2904245 RepID=UPI001F2B24EF|nr:histidine kinase dimerization/phosphoacceptor domain -containing protein [Fulvivirga ulvae]UII33171.1 ATP-binding protein [Fulvivirga ulvae]
MLFHYLSKCRALTTFIITLFAIMVNLSPLQGQFIVPDSLKKNLPARITSRSEFNAVQNLKNLLKDNMIGRMCFYEDLLPIVSEAETWSKNKGEIHDVLSNKLLKLMLFDKLQWQEQTLRLGNQLLEYEEYYSPIDINRISGILYNNYRQLEAYSEIIGLIPLLEKYQHLENGWRAKGFTTVYDIAMINYKSGNYIQAAKGFIRQMKAFDSIGNQLMVSSMHNNAGLCYYHLSNYKKAMEHYRMALAELKKPNRNGVAERSAAYKKCFEMVVKGNIADIDFDRGAFDKALSVYKEERRSCFGTGGYPVQTAVLYKLAQAYMFLNKPVLAELYIDSTLASINSYVHTDTKIESYQLKGKILLTKGETKRSMIYFEKADHLEDSVRRLRMERDNLVAKVSYESKKKDKDLQKMKEALIVKEKVATQQWCVLGFLLLLFTITGCLYFKSRKDKNTIERQRKSLQTSVREKEVLLKEVHHRVKNNLQVISGLLRIQSKKITNKDMLKLLNDSQNYISSIASVHEMLYRQEEGSTVQMEKYLNKLSEQLFDTPEGHDITVMVSASRIFLSINKAIPIGLITSELLTNAMKYAFEAGKGSIKLSMVMNKTNQYVFKYSDNGQGLPDDFEKNLTKTMGFRLIYMLAEEMEGSIEIKGKDGVTVTVQFSDE